MQRAASVLGVVSGLFLILDVVLTNITFAGFGVYFGWLQTIVSMLMICGGMMISSPSNSSILGARITFGTALLAVACGIFLDSGVWLLVLFPCVPGILINSLTKNNAERKRVEEQQTALASINARYGSASNPRMKLGTPVANAYVASISTPNVTT